MHAGKTSDSERAVLHRKAARGRRQSVRQPSSGSLLFPAQLSAGNSDAIPAPLSTASTAAEERILWPGGGFISPCQTMLLTSWSHTFRTSSGRLFPPTPPLTSSVVASNLNSASLSAKIPFIAISGRRDRPAENCISNFLTGENATATVPKTSNEAPFPTVLALSIARRKPTLNRNRAISRLIPFLAKTRRHSCSLSSIMP